MPGPAARSPSPAPPPAPTASTPGPRATALSRIFETALATTIRTHSHANFAACFPTPAKHCPAALEGVWKQLNAKLGDGCRTEFEAILGERGAVQALNEWDGVLDDARRRKARIVDGEEPERAPHTLSAEELYTSYLIPHLQQATETIEERIQSTQEENARAMERIVAQRLEMDQLVSGLEALVRGLEDSVEAMNEGDVRVVDSLRGEAWKMEGEVRAVS